MSSSSPTAATGHRYPLHAAVWEDDVKRLQHLLKAMPSKLDPRGPGGIDQLDNHGNTALHLCLILNRRMCLETLLRHGNPDCRLQSRDGWSPLAEAVSLGNREMIHLVLERRTMQTRTNLKTQMPLLHQRLQELGDFRLEMHWHFSSWIPFISSFCPSDTNVIFKRDRSVRFDTTIAGFERMRWLRGNLSLLVINDDTASATHMTLSDMKAFLTRYGTSYADCFEKSDLVKKVEGVMQLHAQRHTASRYGNVYMLNHDKKVYAVVSDEVDSSTQMDELINVMMQSERTFTQFNQQKLRYLRTKSGFWGFQSDRHEHVGEYDCQVWDVSGVELVTKVRTEHIEMAKALQGEGSVRGSIDSTTDDHFEDAMEEQSVVSGTSKSTMAASVGARDEVAEAKMQNSFVQTMQQMTAYTASLPPPPPPAIDMETYFDSERSGTSTHPAKVGRPIVQKVRSKTFSGKVWTSDRFPLRREDLLSILRTIAPSSHLVQKIVEFLELDLPPGFPVRLEVPVLPMLTVQVTFQNFKSMTGLDPALFSLQDYVETDRIF